MEKFSDIHRNTVGNPKEIIHRNQFVNPYINPFVINMFVIILFAFAVLFSFFLLF